MPQINSNINTTFECHKQETNVHCIFFSSLALMRSQSFWNITGPAVLTGGFTCGLTRITSSQDPLSCETSPKVTVLAEYVSQNTNQKPYLAAINILFTEVSWIFCGHCSLLILLHSNLKTYIFFFCCLFSYGVGLVESWLVMQSFPVHQTGCPVKSGKLS